VGRRAIELRASPGLVVALIDAMPLDEGRA
jgi:hypothetical protein